MKKKQNVTAASGGYDSQKLVQGGYIKIYVNICLFIPQGSTALPLDIKNPSLLLTTHVYDSCILS